MKNKFFLTFIILITLFVSIKFNDITNKVAKTLKSEPKVIISKKNEYYKTNYYKFVKESKDFIPYSKQDIIDIFFSVLNNGFDTFTFYCPSAYLDCLKDVRTVSRDNVLLTHINNFVSPYNSSSSIKVSYNESGEVNIEITKSYSDEDIIILNQKVDQIINEKLNNDMPLEDKILLIHDYIINITKYDEHKLEGKSKYKSNIAYGPLMQGYGICGGYADAMALFLNKLDVPNFKVASDTHVWNVVYINNKWLHLDLTWDDPVSLFSNVDNIIHKFYLIDTETLENYNIEDHNFDKYVYQEVAY